MFFAAANGPLQALAALLGGKVSKPFDRGKSVRRGTALGPLRAQKPQESHLRCP